ncbi:MULTISPECIES: hypothetical protein [Pseudomonas]|jgi:tellurite resistance protein|uniref:hypothetical protein n=1 Tax=Pseudomonas TaxID=286 RepID=UPI0012592CC1|nr:MULTISPECIES: hypothetical protein [Pseudomonas]VVN15240.1 hypothetical protein PS647_04063 [Pseudomonas fluorescens]
MNTAYTPTVAAAQSVQTSNTSIKNLPVNLFGSVMGLAGLGLAWRLSGQYYGVAVCWVKRLAPWPAWYSCC